MPDIIPKEFVDELKEKYDELEIKDQEHSRKMIMSRVTDNNHMDLMSKYSKIQGEREMLRSIRRLVLKYNKGDKCQN